MTAPLIKICGLQDVETTRQTAQAGADFIGFVHYPSSPRHVDFAKSSLLSSVLDSYKTRSVLLLVDPDDDILNAVNDTDTFDYIQLHGDETPARVRAIKAAVNTSIIKALRVSTAADIAAAQDYQGIVDWLLFDADAKNGEKGGAGAVFDWDILKGFCSSTPWMLSGGLNTSNVCDAIDMLNPMGVDVSSGIETIRGVKDMGKIMSFIGAVHATRKTV